MRWYLNTSEPCESSAIAANLEKDRERWHQARRVRFMKASLARAENRTDSEWFGQQEAPDRADDEVDKQMQAAIKCAALQASVLGGVGTKFQATCSGHWDPNHSDGIDERMSVCVDTVPERAPERKPLPAPSGTGTDSE